MHSMKHIIKVHEIFFLACRIRQVETYSENPPGFAVSDQERGENEIMNTVVVLLDLTYSKQWVH